MDKPPANKITVETRLSVWDDKEGVALEIAPSPDNEDFLILRTMDAASVTWFGKVEITFHKDYAKALGHTLIRMADMKHG